MKPLSSLGFLNLSLLSKPVCDRAVYQLVRKQKYSSFLEIGLQDGERCQNLIRIAQKYGAAPNVRYTGVDQFEAREPDQPQLSLIQMHRKLKSFDARTQLVPGEIESAISRIANSHVRTDLILISAGNDAQRLDSCWFYFPRMLHSGSRVLIQSEPNQAFKQLSRLEVEKMVERLAPQRSAAA